MRESLISKDTDAETEPTIELTAKERKYLRKVPTINGSNILSTLFFGWLYPFVSYGWKRTVDVDSMPELPSEMKSESEF
jgi:hypothetical protein